MLERLDAVQDKESLLLTDEIGQTKAPVPGRADLGIGISEPGEGVVQEAVGGGDAVFRSLAVEGPSPGRARLLASRRQTSGPASG